MAQPFERLRSGIAVACLVGIPTVSMSDEAFDEKVRQTLLNNPEIVLEVFAILERKTEDRERRQDLALIGSVARDLFELPDDHDAEIGPVLVEFVDYQCGYCRRAEAELAALKAEHPEIDMKLMQFPILGEQSVELARLALATRNLYGEEQYHLFNDVVLQGGEAAVSNIDRFLSELGFDVEALREAAASPEIDEELAATHELARKLNISGTPGFVTPSQIHRGFATAEVLAQSALRHLQVSEDVQTQ